MRVSAVVALPAFSPHRQCERPWGAAEKCSLPMPAIGEVQNGLTSQISSVGGPQGVAFDVLAPFPGGRCLDGLPISAIGGKRCVDTDSRRGWGACCP